MVLKSNCNSLLDHTTSQIIKSLSKQNFLGIDTEELILYGKWGMDGSSDQQNFKQKWLTNNDSDDAKIMSDSTVFIYSNMLCAINIDRQSI